ncbi:metallophosphoesterase [Candidatus Bathycorpusculum sp.]|uniref:metallophosphoesterase n=1 Tax=Candidatus Bathycorpusculum sp. TaxID=2994959 RepID=UPI00282AA916|nr:metallophosphoesterase [Candidatus Termitimicrobium sp.]MCL2686243.1 metallophosphoesterase [Candidatus Termitimicrobium sp.]
MISNSTQQIPAVNQQQEPPNNTTKIIGLISDTHIPKKAHYLPKRVIELFEKVDYIIHAGDLVELSVIDELEQIAPVLAVHGNMDGLAVTDTLPQLNSLKLFDWKIGVMHDPDIHFGLTTMRELTKQNGFNVFVYGHTHVANITWENKTLYINPGSPTVPPSIISKPSVGLLRITKETITPQIIEF